MPVSFFCKYTADRLWKSVTTVSPHGRKGGMQKLRARLYRNLNRGQIVGVGRVKAAIPGLNTPLLQGDKMHKFEVMAPDPEYDARIEKFQGQVKRARFPPVHPLERGWSGRQPGGRHFGPPKEFGEESFEGFDSVCLEHKWIAHFVGRYRNVRRVSAFVVVGNRNGVAGFGQSTLSSGPSAIESAKIRAGRRLERIPRLENRTIFQDFWSEYHRSRIFAERSPPGTGLQCHRLLKAICELVGIKDLRATVEGAYNYQSMTKAFFAGLRAQETFQQLADRKRLLVVEFDPAKSYRPVVVAKPESGELRTDSEIEPGEVLDVEELYGEGRHPWKVPELPPFYSNQKGHLLAEWRKYPFRNRQQQKIRLMAEGVVENFEEETVKKWTADREADMNEGRLAIPQGLGLSDVIREGRTDE